MAVAYLINDGQTYEGFQTRIAKLTWATVKSLPLYIGFRGLKGTMRWIIQAQGTKYWSSSFSVIIIQVGIMLASDNGTIATIWFLYSFSIDTMLRSWESRVTFPRRAGGVLGRWVGIPCAQEIMRHHRCNTIRSMPVWDNFTIRMKSRID